MRAIGVRFLFGCLPMLWLNAAPVNAIETAPSMTGSSSPMPGVEVLDRLARLDPAHRNQFPRYPIDSIHALEKGVTVLQIYVDEAGLVADARVDTSSGYPRLDQAARDGVMAKGERAWHFLPAEKAGKAVGTWSLVSISWDLRSIPIVATAVGKALADAQSAAASGDYAAALRASERAHGAASNSLEQFQVSEMLAFIYTQTKNFSKAADAIEIALEKNWYTTLQHQQRLIHVCHMRYSAKEFAAALVACNRSLKEVGPQSDVYSVIALIYQEQKRYTDSVEIVKTALAADMPDKNIEGLLWIQFRNYVELEDLAGKRAMQERLAAIRSAPVCAEQTSGANSASPAPTK